MITFKQFLAEYASKENAKFFGISKIRAGGNGKSLDSQERIHQNLYPKNYKHKHPVIDSITQSKANNVPVAGRQLISILSLYNVQFEPGVKTLGNSDVEIEMSYDSKGLQRGILRNKKQNGL